MSKRVIVSNKEGVAYSVTEADFRKLYADEGFRIDSYEDGTPYDKDARSGKQREGGSKSDAAATPDKEG